MASRRKFKPGDRVILPDGRRATIVPTWHESPSLCVLPDHGDPEFVTARELRAVSLLDRLAEEAEAPETGYTAGDRMIIAGKDGPIDSKVALVTVHGEIVLYDGERLVVAKIKKGGRHKAVRKKAKRA